MTTLVEVAKKCEELLVAQQTTLGIADIMYGDTPMIARTPTVAIDTGMKTHELNGAPRRVQTDHTVYIMVYHNDLSSPASNREDNDRLAEAIEDWLHQHSNLDGLVIHSMVTAIEPGYANRNGTIYQATRLTFSATSQEMLP